MKIQLASAELDANFIRHARTETLIALDVEPNSASIEPVGLASYLFAIDEKTNHPVGLTETALLRDLVTSYDDGPNSAICDLSRFCPFDQMSSIRTVYVEPEFRTSLVFFSLTLGAAKLCHDQGARFTTATTLSTDTYLRTLYAKCGGELAGTGIINGVDTALFVFDLERSIAHRSFNRLARNFAFLEPSTANCP